MAGKTVEQRAGHLQQLRFDSLTEVPAGDTTQVPPEKKNGRVTATSNVVTDLNGEVYRPAPVVRRKRKKPAELPIGIQQFRLDDLFALPYTQEQELPREIHVIPQIQKRKKQPGHLTQLDFNSLAKLPPENGGGVPEGKPSGNGTGGNGAAVQRSDAPSDSHKENGLSRSLGDSDRPIPAARRRRVILDDGEPARPRSRDLHITPEHRVGIGSLHEKARANIEAIRLVKAIEADNRDASDAEKGVLVRYAGWGALKDVFEPQWRIKREWKEAAIELKSLLTEEEYKSARATTPNAHFTSPLVISAIWQGLQHLGVEKNIQVLEPAMGMPYRMLCNDEW